MVVAGLCICKCEAGEKPGTENLKQSCCGLVSGLPCQMVVEGGGGVAHTR
jgi:hypothetical protein